MNSMLLEISHAKYMSGYMLKVTFNNGECRTFDFADLIARYPVFAPLGETDRFKAFTVTDTIECENGHIDIAPEYIYDYGISNTLNS